MPSPSLIVRHFKLVFIHMSSDFPKIIRFSRVVFLLGFQICLKLARFKPTWTNLGLFKIDDMRLVKIGTECYTSRIYLDQFSVNFNSRITSPSWSNSGSSLTARPDAV